jgi:hypothetical protein
MEKVSWKDNVTNAEVLARVQCSANDDEYAILRHQGLLKDIIEGRMKGKATRGWKRIRMLTDLLKDTNYAHLKKEAEIRVLWRRKSVTC